LLRVIRRMLVAIGNILGEPECQAILSF